MVAERQVIPVTVLIRRAAIRLRVIFFFELNSANAVWWFRGNYGRVFPS